MTLQFPVNNKLASEVFINQAGLELKRAERYRIFVSLVVLDLSFDEAGDKLPQTFSGETIADVIRSNVRSSDNFAFLDDRSVAILFPETSRQGAEVTARRISEAIRGEIKKISGNGFNDVIPLEMASYPDSGGARTIAEFLAVLADRKQN